MEGNPGKRPLGRDEIDPPLAMPEPPDVLGPVAYAEWERAGAILFDIGMITGLDRAALAAYCVEYARWIEAESHLKFDDGDGYDSALMQKSPNGYMMPSGWLVISQMAQKGMHRWLSEFGMTPATRARIVGTAQLRLPFGDGDEAAASEYIGRGRPN